MEIDTARAAFGLQLQEIVLCTFLWTWPRLRREFQDSILALAAFISFSYAWKVFKYRQARRRHHNHDDVVEQVPPTYPSMIPFLGNAISMIWDTGLFIRVAT
ncbi:hypothetical protein F4680DRAFT_432188 [Xylaria scruposa]|nr:hypothetical protein F4680DRAFT_432188 [Xylaria scruposa]